VSEESLRIWAAIARLEPREAAAIQLYYREDWPLDEIAEALGCPVNTVKTLLFRGRERLRQRLKEKEERP
jgi:RNA polymerase sigma-70 factor (ECF subfamily)